MPPIENNHSLQQPGMEERLRKLSASMKERACKLSITSIERGMYLNDPLSTWKKIVYPQPVEQYKMRAGSRHWERKDEANCLLHLSILIVQKKRIGRVQKSCSRKRRKGESRDIRSAARRVRVQQLFLGTKKGALLEATPLILFC